MKKLLFAGLMVIALVATTFAAGPIPDQAADLEAVVEAAGELTEAAYGSCSGCSGNWVWSRVKEVWRWVSGSEERIWCYYRYTYPSYTCVDTGDARHIMFIEAASSAHYIGCYWTSSTAFSNVRLWYY